jgi:hypothetical protein
MRRERFNKANTVCNEENSEKSCIEVSAQTASQLPVKRPQMQLHKLSEIAIDKGVAAIAVEL